MAVRDLLLHIYFVVLRIGGGFGVFGVFAASYFIILRIGGFLGFFCCFILYHFENW